MGGSRIYVGVDVHKNFSFVCAMKENGEIILEKKVRTEELEKLLEEIPGNKTIILEPTTQESSERKTKSFSPIRTKPSL